MTGTQYVSHDILDKTAWLSGGEIRRNRIRQKMELNARFRYVSCGRMTQSEEDNGQPTSAVASITERGWRRF